LLDDVLIVRTCTIWIT